MSKKLNVAVLMGGKSKEHEISLISGREVVRNLNPKKYNVLPIIVSRDGITWQIGERENFLLDSPSSSTGPTKKSDVKKSRSKNQPTISDHSIIIKNNQIDVVFIVMHGPNGEDGKVQGFLDLIDVPYTGSGVLASALGMDKIYSRIMFTQSGLSVPKYVTIRKGEKPNKVWEKLKSPVFIKPRFQGSSVGTSKVNSKKELKKALKKAFNYDDWAIVEEYLDGTEVTCAILGNERPEALPLVEIATKKEYFDYEAKYDPNLTEEIVPARINRYLTNKAQQAALTAYQTIGCQGFGRVDMIIRNGKVYVLEVNTIPGLTPVSLFPKAAQDVGISYTQLLDRIINLSLAKN